MIKGFNEYINENIADIRRRYMQNDGLHKEEIMDNVDNLKEVDLGLKFYVADDMLRINDDYYHRLEDVINFEKKGWRLPTEKELRAIMSQCQKGGIIDVEYIRGNLDNGGRDTLVFTNRETGASVRCNSIGLISDNETYMGGEFLIFAGNTELSDDNVIGTGYRRLSKMYITAELYKKKSSPFSKVSAGALISLKYYYPILLVKSK